MVVRISGPNLIASISSPLVPLNSGPERWGHVLVVFLYLYVATNLIRGQGYKHIGKLHVDEVTVACTTC
jgi:hypothetical protein